ncbi:ATPase, F1/V1/A1 complex, alpha/beta subunit, Zinc knuckle CX2CX4HX4C [Artemisia annua]|uniref:ATPase, F1/V1/A1 complex, alpha/beta subunit, Zinc knuckle CX2CX4HX4C n=1 Tax=Artemisia annua TaxID=35608 RepID=A0A2U1KDE2_ARTAN|nr:ATPase, F1/V1/A1 complex, alpha/beta subunit, Zinc knuckle CX2CX4HX4C [Artemisia annua]
MDQTTARMCNEGRGRLGYARVLVEISAEKEFKDKIEICYQNDMQGQYGHKFVNVEYAWKPPKCSHCKVFGHNHDNCSIRPRSEEEINKAKNVEINENINTSQNQNATNGAYRNQQENKNQKQRAVSLKNGNMRKENYKKHAEFRPKNVQGKVDTMKNAGNNDMSKKVQEKPSSPLKQWNVSKGIV